MWFRNLQIYRLPAPWDMNLANLDEQLARQRFAPCGSQDFESRGWVCPLGGDGPLVHAAGGQWLLALRVEQRLLPTSVVRQEADFRAEEIAAAQGYKLGRKQMKELREEVTRELLPRAFLRRRTVWVWIDRERGWMGIDAASPARADEVIETLRRCLDTLPLAPLRTQVSPASAMAGWLAGSEAPAGFSIDQDCELRDAGEARSAVRYVRHSLDGEDVRGHLAAGKQPTRLALSWAERISFVLTDKLELKRLAFLDLLQEQLDGTTDAAELFDAQLTLMGGELAQLLPDLISALGGEPKRDDPPF